MRSMSLGVRAPQAVGSRAFARQHYGVPRLQLIQGGLSESAQAFQQAVALYVYLISLQKRREKAAEVIVTPTDVNKDNQTTPEDWRRWEAIRENRRWSHRASMPRLAVESFGHQVKNLVSLDQGAIAYYQQLRPKDKVLGDFIRHFFAYHRSVGKFCEWMSECPFFRGRILHERYGVTRFNELETSQDKRAVRSEMRVALCDMLCALVATGLSTKARRSSDETRTEIRLRNSSTREWYCAIVDLAQGTIIAFYPESEMNRKRARRSPRQFDRRMKRYH